MELLLQIDDFEDKINGDGLTDKDKEAIKKHIDFEEADKVDPVNIGPGADMIVILTVINLIVDIFLIGSRITEGFDGWLKIGKKLRKLIKRSELVSVDNDGATILAIDYISRYEKITSLTKVDETTINLVDVSGMIPANKRGIASKPHNYYIKTFEVNDDKIYVVGIKSTGEVNLIKCFGFNPYGISECKPD